MNQDITAMAARRLAVSAEAKAIHQAAVKADRRNSPAVLRQLAPLHAEFDQLTATLKAAGYDFKAAK
jgi:hypothetical protein